MPYILFATLLYLFLFLVLRLYDVGDASVLSGPLYPYLPLPVGASCPVPSLEKRQGLYPPYLVAYAGLLFCSTLLARLVFSVASTDMLPIILPAVLTGGLTGVALWRRRGGAEERWLRWRAGW